MSQEKEDKLVFGDIDLYSIRCLSKNLEDTEKLAFLLTLKNISNDEIDIYFINKILSLFE